MKKIFFVLFTMLLTIVPFTPSASADTPEKIIGSMPESTKTKFYKEFNYGYVLIRRFVIQGNSIDDWTEAFEVINAYNNLYPKTPEEYYNQSIEERKKICSITESSIIDKSQDSITFEITSKNCPPAPDEQSLTKVLYGNTNIFILIYTNKTMNITQETRDAWLRSLATAFIMPAFKTNQ